MTVTSPGIINVQAWIPEDFNLDIHVSGDITGVNMKDTKLISKGISLVTDEGSVNVRKARNDECFISAPKGVKVGSYLESGDLKIVSQGDVEVTKRLGIVKKGSISSSGTIKCGSIFSQMANLPKQAFTQVSFEAQLEAFDKLIKEP